jgi:hypothetical protein
MNIRDIVNAVNAYDVDVDGDKDPGLLEIAAWADTVGQDVFSLAEMISAKYPGTNPVDRLEAALALTAEAAVSFTDLMAKGRAGGVGSAASSARNGHVPKCDFASE